MKAQTTEGKLAVELILLAREHKMKRALADLMNGCEPTKPALDLSGNFYRLVYTIQALDIVRGTSHINGIIKHGDAATLNEDVAKLKQYALDELSKLRQSLDDFEQYLRVL